MARYDPPRSIGRLAAGRCDCHRQSHNNTEAGTVLAPSCPMLGKGSGVKAQGSSKVADHRKILSIICPTTLNKNFEWGQWILAPPLRTAQIHEK